MSTLVVDELRASSLSQPFSISGGPIVVASIKAQLYVHNLPAGTFSMTLKRGSEAIFSWPFTSMDLQNSFGGNEPYFYVKYPFYVSSGIRLDRGDYLLELSNVGYSYSGASWIGWCKDWQGPLTKISDPQPTSFINYPYAYQILEYSEAGI